ncbi:hypothetical protein DNTS_001590 [Danionella cerebrum]|uniref:Uncharacterized protein n=1 Tax=Danionella cerebrum TaxID=2873325 RepID=A0A553MN53_9TELE|nr:hypothetical protein DNTS_001590 [Danionella translucida]TRY54590.1 hypothetical protein DNTS_001590 [Danionella translucida]TRY54591.1 hypothetical protein DNTS_001590 [Danionella translucida]TRY54592.1 hypothetical protein DNTS_001590 [Danionella translucida]
MANFANDQEGSADMLMLEPQQRTVGTSVNPSAVTANGDTSVGEPLSAFDVGGSAAFRPPGERNHHHHQQQQPPQQHLESPVRKGSSSIPNRAYENSAASSTHATSASPAVNKNFTVSDDIRKCGYLRKQKHGHKRFFVLRASSHLGPSRLEYYDSEKKFRNTLRSSGAAASGASPPKRVIYLYQCFTVNKRADAKNKHLIALYTKDEYFAIVAENEQEREDWYQALSELMSEGKRSHLDAEEIDDGYGTVTPGTVFKEVWQVNVKPKGLGQTKNLTGVYRLCLSTKSIHLVKLNSETPCVNMQLMNIRRCGHSESFFFIEVGRSSSIGPGEVWMQVDDSVVAQNMHETILETMKALKAFTEFRPRSKSQSSGTNPMGFITTRRHLGNLPPSQTGLQRRSRTESVVGTPPSRKSSAAGGYRFRTSSEGESTMNRIFNSVTGSLIHLNTARANLSRQESSSGASGARYIRAPPASSYHARSASLPVSHFPSTTSPISVSSSSGHGSVSDTITRPSSASVCGSPSDGGFNSSDEYGSSPGDLRYFRVRSNTPESLGNTPPIREEHCLNDYMAMGWNRDVFGTSISDATRDESTDEDSRPGSLRRRTSSLSRQVGGAGAATVSVYQKMTQTSLDEAVTESSCWGGSAQTVSTSSSLCSDYSSSSEHSQDRPPSLRHTVAPIDDGYMPMIAGVLPSANDSDYTPMQPTNLFSASSKVQSAAVNVPHHMDSNGYMMMLPGRGGGTDSPVLSSPDISRRSERQMPCPENAEYMDMSQTSSTASAQRPPMDNYYALTTPGVQKSHSPYFSLPRSYKAPSRNQADCDDYVPMSSPVKSAYASPTATPDRCSRGSSSESSQLNGFSDRRAIRPNRLPLGRRSLHTSLRASEMALRPSSPGDYINIEHGERPTYSTENSSSTSKINQEHRRSPLPQDYMSVEVDGLPPKSRSPRASLVAPWNPPSYIRPSSSSLCSGLPVSQAEDYTEMSFGPEEESKSPTAMLERLCVLEQQFFPFSPPTEPKVIRADPQGRRRHSSETFSNSSGASGTIGTDAVATVHSNSGTQQVVCSKAQNFECAWIDGETSGSEMNLGTSSLAASAPSVRSPRTLPVENLNGLNYIALDLREDPRPGNAHDELPSSSSSSPPENGAYASIDLMKSEELAAVSKD